MKKIFRFTLILLGILTLFSCNPFSVDDGDEYNMQAGKGESVTNTVYFDIVGTMNWKVNNTTYEDAMKSNMDGSGTVNKITD